MVAQCTAHAQLKSVYGMSTVDFQLVVQKSRRESAHARTWAGILNRKFCACVNSRRNFWTTNWKSTVGSRAISNHAGPPISMSKVRGPGVEAMLAIAM